MTGPMVATSACSLPDSIKFALVKGLPTALAVVVIGLIVVGIAYRRVQVLDKALKLDLFDKRFGVFLEVRKVLSEVAGSGVYRSGGVLSPFNSLIPQAAFLFGPEVEAYLKTAVRQWAALWAIQMRTQANGNTLQPTDVVKVAELTRWFSQEATQGAKQLFGKYLDLQTRH